MDTEPATNILAAMEYEQAAALTSKMVADSAALAFAELEYEAAACILSEMDSTVAAGILSEMDSASWQTSHSSWHHNSFPLSQYSMTIQRRKNPEEHYQDYLSRGR